MRVITGSARGIRLKSREGEETRPTSDRVKETIFNIIQFDVEGRQVLDLFAGSGQLGIEALSRGAAGALFVDSSAEAVAVVKENLAKTKLAPLAEVRQGDYRQNLLGLPKKKFGLVFLDPPYGTGQLARALNTISQIDIMVGNGIIICESDRDERLPPSLPGFITIKEAVYGRTRVTLYRRSEAEAQADSE